MTGNYWLRQRSGLVQRAAAFLTYYPGYSCVQNFYIQPETQSSTYPPLLIFKQYIHNKLLL